MQITGLHILEVFDSRVQLFELIAGDGQLFALLLDELSRGFAHEAGVIELGFAALDIALHAVALLGQARGLLGHVHEVAQRDEQLGRFADGGNRLGRSLFILTENLHAAGPGKAAEVLARAFHGVFPACLRAHNQVRAAEFVSAQLADILRLYVKPCGITRIDAAPMGQVANFAVETGYTCWQVLTGFCRHSAEIFPRFLPDGTLVSPPLEDLAPFLPREELEKQMFIPMMPEE